MPKRYATSTEGSPVLHELYDLSAANQGQPRTLCGAAAPYGVDCAAASFCLEVGTMRICYACYVQGARLDDLTLGCLPDHRANEDVQAAVKILARTGHEPTRINLRVGEVSTGFFVTPGFPGEVNIYRIAQGDYGSDRIAHPFIDAYLRALLTAGWRVHLDSLHGRVIANRPAPDDEAASVTPEPPREHPGV